MHSDGKPHSEPFSKYRRHAIRRWRRVVFWPSALVLLRLFVVDQLKSLLVTIAFHARVEREMVARFPCLFAATPAWKRTSGPNNQCRESKNTDAHTAGV